MPVLLLYPLLFLVTITFFLCLSLAESWKRSGVWNKGVEWFYIRYQRIESRRSGLTRSWLWLLFLDHRRQVIDRLIRGKRRAKATGLQFLVQLVTYTIHSRTGDSIGGCCTHVFELQKY